MLLKRQEEAAGLQRREGYVEMNPAARQLPVEPPRYYEGEIAYNTELGERQNYHQPPSIFQALKDDRRIGRG
jgi:hypothetical protein